MRSCTVRKESKELFASVAEIVERAKGEPEGYLIERVTIGATIWKIAVQHHPRGDFDIKIKTRGKTE